MRFAATVDLLEGLYVNKTVFNNIDQYRAAYFGATKLMEYNDNGY